MFSLGFVGGRSLQIKLAKSVGKNYAGIFLLEIRIIEIQEQTGLSQKRKHMLLRRKYDLYEYGNYNDVISSDYEGGARQGFPGPLVPWSLIGL